MAENCAAASRPGSARAHASDNNSGKSFRLNIDLGCGPSPAYGPAHGTCSALLPVLRAVAKIAHNPQRIISEEIGICYRRFGAANPARFFLLLSGRGSRGPLSRGVYRGSDQGPG